MENTPLVCDYGSGFSKVGYAGMEAPRPCFQRSSGNFGTMGTATLGVTSGTQVVAMWRRDPAEKVLVGMEEKDWFIGAEVQKNREKLNLEYPISRANITNWDHMEKIWHHSFYQVLRVAPEWHPLMVAEPPLNPTSSKERVNQIMFETFNVPALYLANQGVLSLYSSGQTSGTTIESGEGTTYLVPTFEGCPLHQSIVQMDVAGQDLTLYLLQLLAESGHSFMGTGDREFVRDMKEKCCYVALDFDKEKVKAESPSYKQKYQLPDGQEIEIGKERFFCPEALFQTDLIGSTGLGLHMAAYQSISSCDPKLWKSLYSHVLLSGGTGSCSGLRFRMQREMSALVSPSLSVKVLRCPYSTCSAWVGGSILCSLSTFRDMWVTREEYSDIGSSVISRKSF